VRARGAGDGGRDDVAAFKRPALAPLPGPWGGHLRLCPSSPSRPLMKAWAPYSRLEALIHGASRVLARVGVDLLEELIQGLLACERWSWRGKVGVDKRVAGRGADLRMLRRTSLFDYGREQGWQQ
jgi:hypothetical protein